MNRLAYALPIALVLLFVSAVLTTAQEIIPAAECEAPLMSLWTQASNACVVGPEGTICNGGSAPNAEPAGPVSNALASTGALVEVDAVTKLHTPPLDVSAGTGGIAWLRLAPPLSLTALLIGDVSISDVTPPDFPAWTSILMQTGQQQQTCAAAPANLFVVQNNTPGSPTRTVINGVSVNFDGTIIAWTFDAETHFITLSGQANLIVLGREQILLTGQQLTVPYAPGDFTRPIGQATIPVAYDPAFLRNLPVALFARPIILPQPGYVRTEGVVNLRSEPSQYAGIIREVAPGEVMSVLGQNPAGDWYHVQLDTGETGWMFAEILQRNLGPIQTVYEATPLPPQRFGELGSAGRVIAPSGVNIRTGPDAGFPVVATVFDGTMVNLLARSPYSPWVKVDSAGTVGWLALISIDTHAFIDALPIDYNVPPPPTPTLVPGTWGNAFPDPDGE